MGLLKMYVENLGWTFNGTAFGDRCWKLYEELRRRELRKADRRKRKQ